MAPTPEQIKLLELAARQAIAHESDTPNSATGKLSARERIETLLDKATFEEIGQFVTHRTTDFDMHSQRPPGDGVLTGYGRIHGRNVCVFAHDATVFEGSLSEANAAKIVKLIDTAIHIGAPLIGFYDSIGTRMQEGIAALAGSTDILFQHIRASGIIPQIVAILGSCTGTTATATELADFTFTSHGDDSQCLAIVRELLTFLPSSSREAPPQKLAPDIPFSTDNTLDTFIPASGQPYDMREVLDRIVDPDSTGNGYMFQIQEQVAPNILIGFAHMNGRSTGIVANQPTHLGGLLDSDACIKATRFVRFCDAFNIPLITFVDTSALAPQDNDLHPAMQLLSAYSKATVPKLTVVVRKAYGMAYSVMGSKHLHADLNLAWPTAEILADEPEAAISSIYKRELESTVRRVQAIMPQGVTLSEEKKLETLAEARKEKVDDYRERFANPYIAVERGYIDAVIRPSETRQRLNSALDRLVTRRNSVCP